MAESSSKAGGIGFVGALQLAFIVLKLTGVLDWSWWWVLAPLWIGCCIFAAALVVVGIVALVVWWRTRD